MAGNTVELVLAGDSKSLEKAFSSAGSAALDAGADFDKASGNAKGFSTAMDATGAAAGGAESKFMGTADLLDGLGGAFGLPTEGATGMMRAFGDLSGGFEVVQGMFSSGIGKLGQLATSLGITSAATSVWTAVQAAFNVVMSLNPAVLITAAIIALGVALVLAYQKSETFRNIVQGAFNVVKDAAIGVWDFIKSIPDKLWALANTIKDALLWPYKTAFNLIAGAWNSTVGKLSFEIPSWVPGLGGKGFSMPDIPTFHTGGLVGEGRPFGTPVPIMALAGETVSPIGNAGGGGGLTVIVQGNVLDGRDLGRLVQSALVERQGRTGNLGIVAA